MTATHATEDWLNNVSIQATNSGTTTSGAGGAVTNCIDYGQTGYYGQWYPTYTITQAAPRPIRLTMAEVEKLRKLAKSDDSIKAILQKFTSQIEIEVSF